MSRNYLLIVEPDNELLKNTVEELSELTDTQIITAADGVQAARKAKNQTFNVIMSEYVMPKMSGAEFIKAVRETELNEQTPIIIYTESIQEAKTGIKPDTKLTLIQKPTSYSDLHKKIKELENFDPNKKIFKLDVDFINPFIDTAVATLSKLCGLPNISALKPYLLEKEKLDIDISGTLAISSPYFKGLIAISFKDDIYKAIMAKMLDQNVSEIDVETQDAVAEMINIIYGQTKAVLNEKGYELERAVPAVARGPGHQVTQDKKLPILLVPFRSEIGNFWIQICVKAI